MSSALSPLSNPFLPVRPTLTRPRSDSAAYDVNPPQPSPHSRGSTASSATFASGSTVVASMSSGVEDDLLTPPVTPDDSASFFAGPGKIAHSPSSHGVGIFPGKKHLSPKSFPVRPGPTPLIIPSTEQPQSKSRARSSFHRAASWTITLGGLAKRARQRSSSSQRQPSDGRKGSHTSSEGDHVPPSVPSGKTGLFNLRRTSHEKSRSGPASEEDLPTKRPVRPMFRRARSTTHARHRRESISPGPNGTGDRVNSENRRASTLAPLPDYLQAAPRLIPPLDRAFESLDALKEYSRSFSRKEIFQAEAAAARWTQEFAAAHYQPLDDAGADTRRRRSSAKTYTQDPLEVAWREGVYRGTRGRAKCSMDDEACLVQISGLVESVATSVYLRHETEVCIHAQHLRSLAFGIRCLADFDETVALPPGLDATAVRARWGAKGCLIITIPLKPPPGPPVDEPRDCPTSTGVSQRRDAYRMEDELCF